MDDIFAGQRRPYLFVAVETGILNPHLVGGLIMISQFSRANGNHSYHLLRLSGDPDSSASIIDPTLGCNLMINITDHLTMHTMTAAELYCERVGMFHLKVHHLKGDVRQGARKKYVVIKL